jgi:hypothetical protein
MMQRQIGVLRWLVSIWPAAFNWLNSSTSLTPSSASHSHQNRSNRRAQAVRQMVVDNNQSSMDSAPSESDVPSRRDVPRLEPSQAGDPSETMEIAHPTAIQTIRRWQPSDETNAEWESTKHIYRDIWQRGPGRAGGDWEDAEPGYQYGFERATEEHLRGHSWKQVEVELSRGFPDWATAHGYDARWTIWTSIQDHVQDVWAELAGPLRITRLRRRAS